MQPSLDGIDPVFIHERDHKIAQQEVDITCQQQDAKETQKHQDGGHQENGYIHAAFVQVAENRVALNEIQDNDRENQDSEKEAPKKQGIPLGAVLVPWLDNLGPVVDHVVQEHEFASGAQPGEKNHQDKDEENTEDDEGEPAGIIAQPLPGPIREVHHVIPVDSSSALRSGAATAMPIG